MLVRIKRHLEDFQSLGVILVVYLTQLHYALCGTFRTEDMEVQQHHPTLHVCQPALVAMIVSECDFYYIRNINL